MRVSSGSGSCTPIERRVVRQAQALTRFSATNCGHCDGYSESKSRSRLLCVYVGTRLTVYEGWLRPA
jgi:hypothetical protein